MLTGTLHTADSTLKRFVEAVHGIVEQDLGVAGTAAAVEAAALEIIPADFTTPEELSRVCEEAPYTRNLVYSDPRKRFAIVAMVWGPFRETRIHDHLSWCVVRCLQGSCFETTYSLLSGAAENGRAEVCAREGRVLSRGASIGITTPPSQNLHRMANAGWPTAITLHIYGDPGTRARVFDPVERTVSIVGLRFHNLPDGAVA